jgi:hypothetical protein
MPPADTTNPTKAALEAAVLDLTDEEIARALRRASATVKAAFDDRAAYTWPGEARHNLVEALLRRLQEGRVSPP